MRLWFAILFAGPFLIANALAESLKWSEARREDVSFYIVLPTSIALCVMYVLDRRRKAQKRDLAYLSLRANVATVKLEELDSLLMAAPTETITKEEVVRVFALAEARKRLARGELSREQSEDVRETLRRDAAAAGMTYMG